jgi:short-subunit dehydrogenase
MSLSKKILITGARSGIMASVVEKIKDDYEIYLTVHTKSELEITTKKYSKYKNIHPLKLDVLNASDREKLENLDVDILISNSAVGYGGSISEIDMNLVRNNFEVNVFSNFEVVQIILSKMIKKNQGKIIFMSSLIAIYPVPFLGSYAASKASISTLAYTLVKELKYINSKVQIAVIEPGFYHTGFNQVMFQNKYDWMDIDSYFKECINKIKKKENFIEKYIEKRSLTSIDKKIIKAIKDKNVNMIYRAPFTQSVVAKIYQIFKT